MDIDYYQIGQNIRNRRKARGLSQEQLAERVGISAVHMSHIETGSTKLSLSVFAKTAKALDASADELLFGAHFSTSTERQNRIISDIVRAVQDTLRRNGV